MKIHVGNGPIYLAPDWMNIDLRSDSTCLAAERPDLVEKLATDESDYYRHFHDRCLEDFERGPVFNETVCDKYGTFDRLPIETGVADCILARQVFEHLSMAEAKRALIECDRVLKPGGLLRLDVPDHDASIDEYCRTGRTFFKRHILGSRKDETAYHVMGYKREALIKLCSDYCFDLVEEEANPHFYPAICLKFKKMELWKASWEFAGRDQCGNPCALSVPDNWCVVEVGPGNNPWPRADCYVDINEDFASNAVKQHSGRYFVGDAQNLPLEPGWAYVLCSHVLEHVDDPVRAAAELSRVAKAGMVVLPSFAKDALFAFHELDHKWFVHQSAPDGVLRFQRYTPELIRGIHDDDMSRVSHRLFRLGPGRLDHDSFVARRWWKKAEPWLDVCQPWEGELKVELIR